MRGLTDDRGSRRGLGRTRFVAIACMVVLAGAGWLYLGLALAAHLRAHPLDPGGSATDLLDFFVRRPGFDTLARAFADALCQPSFGRLPIVAGGGIADAAIVFVMWVAMTLAMMLPTAASMILTYADIADTAAVKGTPVVSPIVLIAGYASVWLGFALVATALQLGLMHVALVDPAMGTASPLFAGAIFLAAGAYQFSQLKEACLTRCQRPFPFFFARWSTQASGVFRLGLMQGVFCLGCCWAMMLVMFAVGVMNIVWMVIVGMVMAVEKIGSTTRFSRIVGSVFAVVGVALVVSSVVAHWPGGSAWAHLV